MSPREYARTFVLGLGVVFAVVVVSYDCLDYFHLFSFGVPIVCTPGVSPIYTACFRGLIFFGLAYGAGLCQIRSRSASTAQ